MVEFDFDMAYDWWRDYQGEKKIRALAKEHGITITKIIEIGPAGGNPNVHCRAPNAVKARFFLYDVYDVKNLDDIEDYIDPILAHLEA